MFQLIKILCYISLIAISLGVVSFLWNFNRYKTIASIPIVVNTWAFTNSTIKSNHFFNPSNCFDFLEVVHVASLINFSNNYVYIYYVL